LVWSTTARRAEAQNPAAAEALFEEARAAMAAGNYDMACARFRDSDRLDPAVGTRFNLADCEERRGRLATAWSLFRAVLAELPRDDDRNPIAQERARALEARLPYVTLESSDRPQRPRLRIDGVELGEGSFGVPLPMDPGKHELVTVGEDGRERRREFVLAERQRVKLPVRFSSAKTESRAARSGADAGDGQRSAAYVAGGIGLAGIALGAVTGIITLSKKRTANANCSDALHVCNRAGVEANESGHTFAALSVLGFGVGAVGLGAATFFWLSAPSSAHGQAALPRSRWGVSSGLDWTHRAGFLSVSGSF
jgi:tetratricopeptide (TPR) repeat protein